MKYHVELKKKKKKKILEKRKAHHLKKGRAYQEQNRGM